MPLIDKAIKLHELKKGLKDGAKEAWEDILESKQKNKTTLNDISTFEKRLLRQWREGLKVGDHVDIYHGSGGVVSDRIWFKDTALTKIEPLKADPDMFKHYQIENMSIYNGTIGTNAVGVFPVDYKPGDLIKKFLGKAQDAWEDILS